MRVNQMKNTVWCNSVIILWCVFIVSMTAPISAEHSKTVPNFSTQYRPPTPLYQMPRTTAFEYTDVVVLFLLLCCGAYCVLKKRSRLYTAALMIISLVYFGFVKKGCICPVGSIQNVMLAFIDPSYVIPLSVILFFALPLFAALFFGRIFCGSVCPLGAIQDIVIFKPLRVPIWLNDALRTLPYVYLVVALLFVLNKSGFLICRFDPFVAFFRKSGELWLIISGAVLLLIGTVIARPYCRFLCPYGVLLNWFSRFSKLHLTITPTDCTKCKLCEDSCPFEAIRTPHAALAQEPRNKGVKRLQLLVLLIPVWIVLFGLSTHNLAIPGKLRTNLKETDKYLQELLSVKPDEQQKEEIEDTKKHYQELLGEKQKYGRYGWILGSLLGLIFGLHLAGMNRLRSNKDYVPHKGQCLSCARCIEYCPVEHELNSFSDTSDLSTLPRR